MWKKLFLLALVVALSSLSITFWQNYSMEERMAYDYAYKNGITTMNSIQSADMWWWLTRIAMAKMLSNYAINTLWLSPDTSKDCSFADVSTTLDTKYGNWVTKACQLGLMWVGIANFYPNGLVTRAEFGTVLSRALNAKDRTKLDKMNNASPYYAQHLKYLKEQWIMNNISNSNSLERRWRVMTMLMRSDENSNNDSWRDLIEEGNGFTYRSKIVQRWNWNNYRNEEYWFHLTLPETWNDCIVAHQQTVSKKTNKTEHEEFQLICPWEYAWDSNVNSYIPNWYARLVDIVVVWPDTNDWTLSYLADQTLLENNKYKFWFGISDASKDIFDWKINASDLECWKYPNCTCHEKDSYLKWEYWDKVPDNYQEIWCFITTIVKDHIEIFDV